MTGSGWVGVDLDGTLAYYGEWTGGIGKPIPLMLARVKQMVESGVDVRIFTARISHDEDGSQRKAIEDWCEEHIGVRLAVTNAKDYGMIWCYDDRAISVEPNTGRICACVPR